MASTATAAATATSPAPPAANPVPVSNGPGSETSSDDEYELVGADTVTPAVRSNAAPATSNAPSGGQQRGVESEDIEALMALAEFASAPAVADATKKRPRIAEQGSTGSVDKKKPKSTASAAAKSVAVGQAAAYTEQQAQQWRQQQAQQQFQQQQQQQAQQQQLPPPQQHQQQQARKAGAAQPSVTAATGATGSRAYASVMPAHNRCSRHVAIAYYIYYQQRAALMKQQGARATQVIMDPTLEARRLKEKSEWLKRTQQQQIAADQGIPPGAQYIMGYGQGPYGAPTQFAQQQQAFQMSMMQQPQQYMHAYASPYYAAGAIPAQPNQQLTNQYLAYAAQHQQQQMMQHHMQQQQQQQQQQPGGGGAVPQLAGTQPQADQLRPEQLLTVQNAYAQHVALAQARFSQTLRDHSTHVQAARQMDATGAPVRQAPLHSAPSSAASAAVKPAAAPASVQQAPQPPQSLPPARSPSPPSKPHPSPPPVSSSAEPPASADDATEE
ncbi:Uncharacterized protein PBTT_02217 [Plasmodiophora brassicae]